MRVPRSVTLQPITCPSRTLKVATDLRALHSSGFWPLIFARSAAAASMTFLSDTASPTPMLIVIFTILGTSITFAMPSSLRRCGTIWSR